MTAHGVVESKVEVVIDKESAELQLQAELLLQSAGVIRVRLMLRRASGIPKDDRSMVSWLYSYYYL